MQPATSKRCSVQKPLPTADPFLCDVFSSHAQSWQETAGPRIGGGCREGAFTVLKDTKCQQDASKYIRIFLTSRNRGSLLITAIKTLKICQRFPFQQHSESQGQSSICHVRRLRHSPALCCPFWWPGWASTPKHTLLLRCRRGEPGWEPRTAESRRDRGVAAGYPRSGLCLRTWREVRSLASIPDALTGCPAGMLGVCVEHIRA